MRLRGSRGGCRSSDVRVDGLLPQAESREDVRGHVNRVRRIGSYSRVLARGGQSLRREFRRIGGVDQIVGDAGIVRILLEERIENGDGFLAVDELVFVVRKANERERVERRAFRIRGKIPVQFLHRRRIGLDARGVAQLRIVLIERRGCRDVVSLASRFRSELLRVCCVAAAFRQSVRVRKIPQLMVERHGATPVRDGALRIGLRGFREGGLRLLILERVQLRHASLNGGLRLRRAGSGEIHFAELIARRGARVRARRAVGETYEGNCREQTHSNESRKERSYSSHRFTSRLEGLMLTKAPSKSRRFEAVASFLGSWYFRGSQGRCP